MAVKKEMKDLLSSWLYPSHDIMTHTRMETLTVDQPICGPVVRVSNVSCEALVSVSHALLTQTKG